MPVLSTPSFGPRTALTYVTVGLMIDVWTGVWYWAFGKPTSNTTWFWLAGFFLTGLSLVVLGLLLGPLGRAARRVELPPSGALGVEADIQRTAAATPNPVVAPQPLTAQPSAVVQPTGVMPAITPAPMIPQRTIVVGPQRGGGA